MTDLLCFSHLRWNFVYQRPQHLITRFSKKFRTFFIEEHLSAAYDHLEIKKVDSTEIYIVIPHLDAARDSQIPNRIAALINKFMTSYHVRDYISWYYSPLALTFTEHLEPTMVIYDCMDELSAFKGASSEIPLYEKKLMHKADLVFTGGNSLFKAKQKLHHKVFSFPSSIDKAHFSQARNAQEDPADQLMIPHPRIGFFGVLDERLDTVLLRSVAALRPDWHFVLIGPIVKILESDLPVANNIHYLGGKSYDELPSYLANWDATFIPFAINDSTRYISPTKTPEFLAGGKPVVATPIQDIIKPYGDEGLVKIVATPAAFILAMENILSKPKDEMWLSRVDDFLKNISWDETFQAMYKLIEQELKNKKDVEPKNKAVYV
jgi:UDP-galactopyranose mutase